MQVFKRVIPYSSNGKKLDMYCTGCGKAMLAYLPENELAEVIKNCEFKKFTDTTITSAALSISGSAYSMSDEQISEYIEPLMAVVCALYPDANDFPAGQSRLLKQAAKEEI